MRTLQVLDGLRVGALLLLAVVSGYTDLKYHKVFNWVNYPALLVGLLLAVAQAALARNVEQIPAPWNFYLVDALGGALFCLFILGAIYLMGGVGFGDVKLMTAAGMLAGFGLSIYILMFSTLVGLAIGLSLVIWKGKFWELARGSFEFRKVFRRQKVEDSIQMVPFGAAFAGGCLWALLLVFLESSGAR